MLAVCVLAMVSVSIYRFVIIAVEGVRDAGERAREREISGAFAHYLGRELLELRGALSGEPHRFGGVSSDEIRWTAGPGSGLLTRHADGGWDVTLIARQLDHGAYELGMRRQDSERKRDANWLPLVRGVRGFEIRYFDANREEWLEKWTDAGRRPSLVRLRLWRDPSPDAYEVVFPVAPGEGGSA